MSSLTTKTNLSPLFQTKACSKRAPSYFPKSNKYRVRRFYSRRNNKHSRSKRACALTDAATLSDLHASIQLFDSMHSITSGFIQNSDDEDQGYNSDSESIVYDTDYSATHPAPSHEARFDQLFQIGELNNRLRMLNQSPPLPPVQLPKSVDSILNSDTWRIIEATTIFWKQLQTAGKKASLKLYLAQYVIAVTGKSISSLVARLWSRLADSYYRFFQQFGKVQGPDDEENNPFSFVKKILSNANMSLNHPIILQLRKVFHFLLSQCLLERFGISYSTFMYSKAEEEASQKKPTPLLTVLLWPLLKVPLLFWNVYIRFTRLEVGHLFSKMVRLMPSGLKKFTLSKNKLRCSTILNLMVLLCSIFILEWIALLRKVRQFLSTPSICQTALNL